MIERSARRIGRGVMLTALACVASVAWVPEAQAQTRTRGLDVSSWQGNSINWSQAKAGGYDFVFVRATRGGTTSGSVTDTRFVANTTGARAAGFITGAYHFARWDLWDQVSWTGPNSPVDEATHFLNVAGSYLTPGHLRPVLDIETDSTATGAETTITSALLTEWALRFCAEIVRVKGIGYTPIVYVNGNFANRELTTDINRFPLWLARYGATGDPLTTGQPSSVSGLPNIYGVWNPTASTTNHPWAFWQYSSTQTNVPGFPSTMQVDQNVFNNARFGSIDAFKIRPQQYVPEPAWGGVLFAAGAVVLTRRREAAK